MGNKYFSVAIDGPGGAGKSSVAKLLANELGFVHVDTGAMYRAVALFCIENSISMDEQNIAGCLHRIGIEIKYQNAEQRIFLGDCEREPVDVTEKIRTPEVTEGSSVVAVFQDVRDKLVSLQRKMAQNADIIMDGRDIGTCVLPFADLKIYLDAGVQSRAQRRLNELRAKGIQVFPDKVEHEIAQRDYRDMHRKHSPLRRADDAVLIDTSFMSLNEVIGEIKRLLIEKRGY